MISWENPWGASPSVFYRLRTLPTYLIWSIVGFVSGWVQTRRIGYLVIGIPALAITFFMIATTLKTREGLTTETVRRYIESSQLHLKDNRIEQAEFYMNRLKSLDYQTDPLLVTRAELATRRERSDLAEICYRDMLTNPDRTLDAVAHQKLALIELNAIQTPNSPHASEAIHHFEQTLKSNPNDLDSRELLAKLFLDRGDLNSAILHLEPVAEQKPAVYLKLARLYEKLGRQVMKTESAARGEILFRRDSQTGIIPQH